MLNKIFTSKIPFSTNQKLNMSSKTVVLVLCLVFVQSIFGLQRMNIGGSLKGTNPLYKLFAKMKVGMEKKKKIKTKQV